MSHFQDCLSKNGQIFCPLCVHTEGLSEHTSLGNVQCELKSELRASKKSKTYPSTSTDPANSVRIAEAVV